MTIVLEASQHFVCSMKSVDQLHHLDFLPGNTGQCYTIYLDYYRNSVFLVEVFDLFTIIPRAYGFLKQISTW